MVYKYTIYTYNCPSCGQKIGRDMQGPRGWGLKFGRCPKCRKIYKTGRKLYSDISHSERETDKKETIQVLSVLIPLFFLSVVAAAITGWELVGLLAFFLFIGSLITFSAYHSKKKETLDRYSYLKNKDPELYQLEYAESMRLTQPYKPKVQPSTPNAKLTSRVCYDGSSAVLKDRTQTYGSDISLQRTPHTSPNSVAQSFPIDTIANGIAELCIKEIVSVMEICNKNQVEYDCRKLIVSTFAYYYVIWLFNFGNITMKESDEVEQIYRTRFCEFNRKYFEDYPFKEVVENEEYFDAQLKRIDRRVRNSYHSNNRTFVDDGLSDEYILQFINKHEDLNLIKPDVVIKILKEWVFTAQKAGEEITIDR